MPSASEFLGLNKEKETRSASEFLGLNIKTPEPSTPKSASEFLGIKKPLATEELPFKAQHPNIYGAWGAAKETVKTIVPYLKYVDPEERKLFMEMDKQHQVRDLLLQNLEAITELGGTRIIKGAAPVIEKYFPKTYKLLTKNIGKTKAVDEIAEEKVSSISKVEDMYDEATEASKRLNRTTPSKIC